MSLVDKSVEIVKAPFVGSLDIAHLFLLVGLVLFFAAVWLMILGHVRAAME